MFMKAECGLMVFIVTFVFLVWRVFSSFSSPFALSSSVV